MNLRLALALICLNPALHAAPPKELVSLQQSYAFAVAERVNGPHETALAALNAKFTAALDNAATQAKSVGDLPAVLAIQADKKLLAEKQPLPADDEKTPESLKKLRAIYRDQLAKLAEQRTANTAALLAPYTAKLQELEATLTKTDRIAEAKEVMDYREGLKADAPVPQAAMAATAPAALAAVPAAPKVKGDDRKAAEWVLSVGGNIQLWDGSSSITVRKPEELPKGRISLKQLTLDNNSGGIKPVTDADFAVCAGLEKLDFINLAKLPITPAVFDTLSTCPSITGLGMQYNRFGDELWAHLTRFPKLTRLHQGYDGLPVTGEGISKMSHENLTELNLTSCVITDAALGEIGGFLKLQKLNIDGNARITDAGMISLAGLKSLQSLHVRGTDITSAGLASVKSLPITKLSFGRSMADVVGQAKAVAALFPKLESLSLPRDVEPTAEDWEAISQAWPALKRIGVTSRNFTDAGCQGIHALAALEEFDAIYSPITDAGLASLAGLKKLFWMNLNEAKITDAGLDLLAKMKSIKSLKLPKPGNGITPEGLAKFKKQRPDVKVE